LEQSGSGFLKYACKVWPGSSLTAFPKEKFHWAPLLNVKLIYKHSPPTKWIEAFADTGAHCCMFHADFCSSLGIKLKDGIEDELGGIIGGAKSSMYFHSIKILVGSAQFQTMVGFSEKLSVAGLLGRRGFFDSFHFSLDGTSEVPSFEIEKINRA
jgi:hypothetical protein